MKKWVHILLFLLFFQVEVRVKASNGALQNPDNCLKNSEVCALQANQSAFRFTFKSVKLNATQGSSLVRENNFKWKFVSGALWIEKSAGLTVDTLYGTAQASKGQYWLIEQGDKVLVRNISADLKVKLRDGKELEVPEGFQFWIAGLNTDAQSDYGMIEPIELKSHLELWNSLFEGTKAEFKAAALEQRESWGDLAATGGLIYQKSVDRKLASIAEEKAEVARKKQAKAAEDRRIKQLFYERTFER